MSFKIIQAQMARELLDQDKATFVDIRDPQSFDASHIRSSTRLDNSNLQAFLAAADKARPTVVCCYHGMSSQSAAQFLAEQGFSEVYSLDGGFEFWKTCHPDACE
ncbi:thiosulfate sulfurtransferase GlpE [Marinospirillum alkaliphilum]|uniref:Thiosulfate sulfurtransferase GlpE n=1 Tax=Marinospirillum alkaliphilum DSM 21637 TaxID=1122209 RepID=A0A1K1VHC7_9GAMM|nr:thiosulfate sulfurtransferase GlpE [Marinospirillum alkaliphilum]SFX24577.1 thiosulfate sulfurtransferase [Marinospirillum alkaliphilum DSM 21637]